MMERWRARAFHLSGILHHSPGKCGRALRRRLRPLLRFTTVGLRYFNVFGQRQDPYGAYAAVIPQWFASLLKKETVFVNGDGETSRDFCYIDNVVQANLLAKLRHGRARNKVYKRGLWPAHDPERTVPTSSVRKWCATCPKPPRPRPRRARPPSGW